jgi:hypothetical protein
MQSFMMFAKVCIGSTIRRIEDAYGSESSVQRPFTPSMLVVRSVYRVGKVLFHHNCIVTLMSLFDPKVSYFSKCVPLEDIFDVCNSRLAHQSYPHESDTHCIRHWNLLLAMLSTQYVIGLYITLDFCQCFHPSAIKDNS